jgi:hypothetical protein
MRLAIALVLTVAVAALLLGCGGSDDSTTAPAGGGGGSSDAELRAAWEKESSCKHPQGASRWGCSVDSYRCQAVVVDRGWSVGCARPGRSIAFTIPPK